MCLPYFIILRDDFTRQGDMQFCVNQTICQCVLLIHTLRPNAPYCTLLFRSVQQHLMILLVEAESLAY